MAFANKIIMLKVMIIDNDIKRSKPLKQSLIDSGFDVVAHVENDINLHEIGRASCRERV